MYARVKGSKSKKDEWKTDEKKKDKKRAEETSPEIERVKERGEQNTE